MWGLKRVKKSSTITTTLHSELMGIYQWGFFSMPHLLCYGASVYNGHLQGPATLKLVAERLAVVLSPPVLTNNVCRYWDSNTSLCYNTHTFNICCYIVHIGSPAVGNVDFSQLAWFLWKNPIELLHWIYKYWQFCNFLLKKNYKMGIFCC